jgi:GT2 family glycosyltransferase
MAAEKSDAEYLCFLNNDTEVMSSGWLRSALDHASQRDVGLVGVSLVNRDSTIQSAGLAIGVHGVAGHVTRGIDYREKKSACFEVSAVSFACAFISRHKFLDLGSLDENFPVGLNDVALGIKSAERGFHNVVCAGVNVYHQEYGSRSSMRNLGGAIQASRDVVLFLRSFGLSQDKYATTEMKKIG